MPHTPMKNAASPPMRAMKRAQGHACDGRVAQEHGGAAFSSKKCGGRLESTRARASGVVAADDLVLERADALDPHLDAVPDAERADTARGAGEHHVTRDERHHAAHEAHQRVRVEQHVARTRALPDLAVDVASRGAGRSDRRRSPPTGRAGRSRRIPWRATTARRPVCRSRAVTSLPQVKPRTFVGRLCGRRTMRPPADHHAQLALVVDPPDAGGDRDVLPGPITAVDGLMKMTGSSGVS